jgi:hypothetical protein
MCTYNRYTLTLSHTHSGVTLTHIHTETHDYQSDEFQNKREKYFKQQGYFNTLHIREQMIQMMFDFSSETMETRRQWNDISEAFNEKNCHDNSVCS